jgi:chromosome segregation ATPase
MIKQTIYNNMRKFYFAIVLGFLFIALAVFPSFAKEGFGIEKANTNSVREADGMRTIKPQSIESLKQRADAEIDRRVKSLTELIAKINGLKKLFAEDKSELSSKLQEQIDSLNALKVKIDADTDLATLKTDTKSIRESYRIYALFLPEIRILIAADSMNTTADRLNALADKLQALITTSGATGDNLTGMQNSLADMRAKVKDAKDLYQSIEAEILALTPQGYPGNRTTLMDAREKLKTGAKDLRAARDDAKEIIKVLRSLNKSLKATGSAGLENKPL